MPDNSQLLYNGLKEQGLYTKSYQDFTSQFSTPEARQQLYEGMNEKGLYTKSAEDFNAQFFSVPIKKKDSPTTTSIPSKNGSSNVSEPSPTTSTVSQTNSITDIPIVGQSFTQENLQKNQAKQPTQQDLGLVGVKPLSDVTVSQPQADNQQQLLEQKIKNASTKFSALQGDDVAIGTLKLQENPNDDNALYQIGYGLSNQGKNTEAQDAYYKALQINPNNGKAQIGLGHIDFSNGDYKSAYENYSNAVKNIPQTVTLEDGKEYNNPDFYNAITGLSQSQLMLAKKEGDSETKTKLLSSANEQADFLLKADPTNYKANQIKADIEIQNGRNKSALEYTNKAISDYVSQTPVTTLYDLGKQFEATKETRPLSEQIGSGLGNLENSVGGFVANALNLPQYVGGNVEGMINGTNKMLNGVSKMTSGGGIKGFDPNSNSALKSKVEGLTETLAGGTEAVFGGLMLTPSGWLFSQGIGGADVITNGLASKVLLAPLQTYLPKTDNISIENIKSLGDAILGIGVFGVLHSAKGDVSGIQDAYKKYKNGESLTGDEVNLLQGVMKQTITPQMANNLNEVVKVLPNDTPKEKVLENASDIIISETADSKIKNLNGQIDEILKQENVGARDLMKVGDLTKQIEDINNQVDEHLGTSAPELLKKIADLKKEKSELYNSTKGTDILKDSEREKQINEELLGLLKQRQQLRNNLLNKKINEPTPTETKTEKQSTPPKEEIPQPLTEEQQKQIASDLEDAETEAEALQLRNKPIPKELQDKIDNLKQQQDAITKISEQTGVQSQLQSGTTSPQTEGTGVSDSVLNPTEGEGQQQQVGASNEIAPQENVAPLSETTKPQELVENSGEGLKNKVVVGGVGGTRTISQMEALGNKYDFIDLGDGLVAFKELGGSSSTEVYKVADTKNPSADGKIASFSVFKNSKGEFSSANKSNLSDHAKKIGLTEKEVVQRFEDAKNKLSTTELKKSEPEPKTSTVSESGGEKVEWKPSGLKGKSERAEIGGYVVDVSRRFDSLNKVVGADLTIKKKNSDGSFTVKKVISDYKTFAEAKKDALNKVNEIDGKGIETLKVKKNEPNNVVLKEKYKNSPDTEFEHGFTFVGELDGKEKVDQSKPFAVGYFGDNSANRYEHATASNDISEVIQRMKDFDSNEGVVEIYNPKTKEKNSFTIYPEANEYTNESVGLIESENAPKQKSKPDEVVVEKPIEKLESKNIKTESGTLITNPYEFKESMKPHILQFKPTDGSVEIDYNTKNDTATVSIRNKDNSSKGIILYDSKTGLESKEDATVNVSNPLRAKIEKYIDEIKNSDEYKKRSEPKKELPSLSEIKSDVIEKSEEAKDSAKKEGISLKTQKQDLLSQIEKAKLAYELGGIDEVKKQGFTTTKTKKITDGNLEQKAGIPQVIFDVEGDGTFKLNATRLDEAYKQVKAHWSIKEETETPKVPLKNSIKDKSFGKNTFSQYKYSETPEGAIESLKDANENLQTAKKSGNKDAVEFFQRQVKDATNQFYEQHPNFHDETKSEFLKSKDLTEEDSKKLSQKEKDKLETEYAKFREDKLNEITKSTNADALQQFNEEKKNKLVENRDNAKQELKDAAKKWKENKQKLGIIVGEKAAFEGMKDDYDVVKALGKYVKAQIELGAYDVKSFVKDLLDSGIKITEEAAKHILDLVTTKEVVGRESVIADLGKAKMMERNGADAKTIHLATGFERGKDGKWRYEIDDSEGRIITSVKEYSDSLKGSGRAQLTVPLSSIITNLKALDAYPELKDMEVSFVRFPDKDLLGGYNKEKNKLVLNLNSELNDSQTKKLIIHELQHAIQAIEGFAEGANYTKLFERNLRKLGLTLQDFNKLPKEEQELLQQDAYKTYYEHAGEQEAFNAERRSELTPKQRAEKMLSETEDVARQDQIILSDTNGFQQSVTPKKVSDFTEDLYNDYKDELKGKALTDKIIDTLNKANFYKKLIERGEIDKAAFEKGIVEKYGEKSIVDVPTDEKVDDGGKTRELSVVKRIRTSEKIKDNEKLASLITDKKSRYKVANQSEARNLAKQVIDEFGIDESLNQARKNTYGGAVSSAIFGEALNAKYEAEVSAKTPKEKQKAAEDWAEILYEYATSAKEKGQFNAQIYDFYKKSPMGMVLYAEKAINGRIDELLAKHEGSIEKAFDELISDSPVKEEFEKRLFNAEKYKKNKEQIKNFWDKAKINTKGTAGAYIIPPQLINGAIEVMKQAHLAGHEIKAIVQRGVDYLNENIKDAWDEKKFRNDYEKKLTQFLGKEKKTFDEKEKERILNKWRKRLTKLSEEDRKRLLGRALTEIVDKGALEYDDFRNMYAEALGLPVLTPEMKDKLRTLATDINGLDVAKEKLQANENPTKKDIEEFKTAQQKATKASTELNEAISKQKSGFDTAMTLARLNTLSIKSLLGNPIFNIAFMPVRFGESLNATALDYILPRFGYANVPAKYRNILSSQGKSFLGFKLGVKKSAEQFVHGMTSQDYFEKEVKQNIDPIGAWNKLSNWATGKKKLTKQEFANAVLEGTAGITAELNARLLGLGDNPFRYSAEYAKAYELGRAKGYSKDRLQAFIHAPDDASAEIIHNAGNEAVMTQDNAIQKYVIDSIGQGIRSMEQEGKGASFVGKSLRTIGTLTQPFLKIPLNSAIRTVELALPEYCFTRALWEAKNGNRDGAIKYFSRAITGVTIATVFSQLAAAGLIMGDDDERKDKNIIEQYFSGGSLNYTGFKRWLMGQDPTYKNGDTLVSLYYFGTVGALMKMHASMDEEAKQKQDKRLSYLNGLELRLQESFVNGIKNNVFGGTSTLINAMNMGGGYVNSWVRGMLNVGENLVIPADISVFSKAIPENKVDLSQGSLYEQIKNDFKNKTFQNEEIPSKISMWGEKVENMNGSSYGGRVMKYLFDVGNTKEVDTNKFGYQLALQYLKTRDTELLPPQPKNNFTYDGNKINLTPKQYEEFQIMVGNQRKSLVAPYLEGATQQSLNEVSHDELVKDLKKYYEQGYDFAKEQFMSIHPELNK